MRRPKQSKSVLCSLFRYGRS